MKNLKRLALSTIAIMAFVFSVNAQKNYLKDADVAFDNHQYFNAIELYKQAYTKVKKADAKARILYRTAQSYQEINELKSAETYYMLVVPMFPQYSAVTAAATFDQVARVLKRWRWIPEMRFVNEYHEHPAYVAAVADSVRRHFEAHGRPQHLVMSYHGIPEKYFEKGDPYYCKCQKSSRLIAEELGLAEGSWSVTFQSRYGPGKWLKPYTDETIRDLPKRGVREVAVVCPGFAADCLETLEEIAMEARDLFIDAGGTRFDYIPALNANPLHAEMFADIVSQHLSGWVTADLTTLQFTATSPRD